MEIVAIDFGFEEVNGTSKKDFKGYEDERFGIAQKTNNKKYAPVRAVKI